MTRHADDCDCTSTDLGLDRGPRCDAAETAHLAALLGAARVVDLDAPPRARCADLEDSVAALKATIAALQAKLALGIDVRKGLTDCAAFLNRDGQTPSRRWLGQICVAVAEALFAVSLVETGREAPHSETRQIDAVAGVLPLGGRVDVLADRCDRLVLLVRKLARRQPSKATRAVAVRWLRESGLLSEGAKP